MVVILKSNAEKQQVTALLKAVESLGLKTNYSEGQETTVVGLVGDTSRVDIDALKANEIVEDVKRISEPYKKANRRFHPMDTIVQTGSIKIGEGFFHVIAGPCSIESEEQLCTIAQEVKKSGATLLRGGAFKPRTSPYSFQGLETDGLKLLLKAKKLTGLPIVTEIMGQDQIDDFADVDIIQVGARNMQNFRLLKALGQLRKPILLKRGLANTIEEFLMSAEYIMAGGNENVILCERGIRTFETMVRNTLDISAIPLLKQQSHLPVIIDPSHAAGIAWMVNPLAKAAIAARADVEGMGLKNTGGYIFYDGNNGNWLDPSKPAARQYLCTLAAELAQQGFDEILLTDVGYPTVGKLDKIDYNGADRAASIRLFLEELRSALGEYGVAVSIELPPEVITSGADDTAGLVLSDIAPLVDRVYAVTTVDQIPALEAAVSAAGEDTDFVAELTGHSPDVTGSCLILAD